MSGFESQQGIVPSEMGYHWIFLRDSEKQTAKLLTMVTMKWLQSLDLAPILKGPIGI